MWLWKLLPADRGSEQLDLCIGGEKIADALLPQQLVVLIGQVATGSTGRQDGGQVVDFQIRIWSENGQQVRSHTTPVQSGPV